MRHSHRLIQELGFEGVGGGKQCRLHVTNRSLRRREIAL